MKKLNLFVFILIALILPGCAQNSENLKKEADIHYRIGVRQLSNGDTSSALRELTAAVEKNPAKAEYYNTLGLAYYTKGFIKEAEENIQKAIQINPNLPEAHTNLGTIYLRQLNWDSAIAQFKEAVKNVFYTAPEEAFSKMCWAYYKKGWYSKAITNCKNAIEKNPSYTLAFNNLGLSYLKSDKGKDAIESFKQAVSLSPQYTEAYYNMGLAYIKTGDTAMAIGAFNQVIRIAPKTDLARSAKKYIKILKKEE